MVPISVFIFSKEFPLSKLHGSLPPYLILPYLDAHSPAVANGVVYVGSFDHKLYAFHLPGMSSGGFR
ncbi:MAG: PQQ-binding-like beta-propeller repeat protein [Ktedonobacteraceae bacterium]